MEPVPTFVNLKWNQKRQKFKNMRWLRRVFKLIFALGAQYLGQKIFETKRSEPKE